MAQITAVPDALDRAAAGDARWPVVMLDSASIRAVPGHQVRNFGAVCGKIEHESHPSRRFALGRSVSERPNALLRSVLQNQSWREGDPVTAISGGDPALPALVRSAMRGIVQPVQDWFHLSMRVHHVEQVMLGLCTVEPPLPTPLGHVQGRVERL